MAYKFLNIRSLLCKNAAFISLLRVSKGLSNAVILSLALGVSSSALAHEFSTVGEPVNDTATIRLSTSADIASDSEITNWWVEAGSTGFGSTRYDYFSSGLLDAPLMVDQEITGPARGSSNVLVMNLPADGSQVFISVWLKRGSQPWTRELIEIYAASNLTTPTAIVVDNIQLSSRNIYGDFLWKRLNGASWYQVWINNGSGVNVHNKWYRFSEVCMNVHEPFLDACAMQPPRSEYPFYGQLWVRGWSVYGGYGAWSQPASLDGELNKISPITGK